eukprot:GILK01003328.1.p1 GENE.GILK01003328.1~~GILK01003328.1.p1  ORF type:complete len:638 (+),score=93.76 GILK01003328.1:35-1915(+)
MSAVVALDGTVRQITELWTDRKALVCFLRHLGCRMCEKQVKLLNAIKPQLDQLEVALVAISMGTPEEARVFLQQTSFEGEIYLDNDKVQLMDTNEQWSSYFTFKLSAGKHVFQHPQVKVEAEKALQEGNKDRPFLDASKEWAGDPFQLGGIFILGPGNQCDYAFRSEYFGDLPNLGDILHILGGQEDGTFMSEATRQWTDNLAVSKTASAQPRRSVMQSVAEDGGTIFPSLSGDAYAQYSSITSGHAMIGLLTLSIGSYYFQSRGLLASPTESPFSFICHLLIAFFGLLIPLRLRPKSGADPSFEFAAINEADSEGFGQKHEEIEEEEEEAEAELVFYTPKEIDTLSVEHGALACDCSNVIKPTSFTVEVQLDRPRSASQCLLIVCDACKQEQEPTSANSSVKHTCGKITARHRQSEDNPLGAMFGKYQTMLCYVREFLARPHPLVGRKGPTCPFIPSSLKKNCLYLSVVRTNPATVTKSRIAARVMKAFKQFFSLSPTEHPSAQFKAVVLIFPDIPAADAHEYIDEVQAQMKEMFVAEGLMLGEFHLLNNCPGLRNNKFYPLRTPFPSLAIRYMVPTDLAFLALDKYPVALRVKFLTSFLNRFGADDCKEVVQAKAELELAKKLV